MCQYLLRLTVVLILLVNLWFPMQRLFCTNNSNVLNCVRIYRLSSFVGVKSIYKNRVTNFRFSLFTKITTTTYLFLFLFGVIVVLILEHSNVFKGLSWHQSLFYALFQSSTTRSAGLQTIDVSHFSDATNIVMGLLMFIGSSPSSVGGGIRTTTFAILIFVCY